MLKRSWLSIALIAVLTGCQTASPARAASVAGSVKALSAADDALVDEVEHQHYHYFQDQNDAAGMAKDRSQAASPSSIAAVGFGLTADGVAVHRGWISRGQAAAHARQVLNALWRAPQGDAKDGMAGYHGLFYHFLDPKLARVWHCELSTIDTALLLAGVRFVRNFYDQPGEADLREVADQLTNRVDWAWAMNGHDRMSMGWKPEDGFISSEWGGYCEGMILLLLAMGSPTHPLPASAWQAYTRTQKPVEQYGQKLIPFAPLFGHQYSHCWVDFRGMRDPMMQGLGWDYFENSRRATLAQHAYAVANTDGWKAYGDLDWGLTACDGPGDSHQTIDGKPRTFFGYMARGCPDGPDDGTIAPTAAAASLPFAPELVMPTLRHWRKDRPEIWGQDGFADGFNPTLGWVDGDRLGIDQGPIVLMSENQRSGFVWEVMKRDPQLRAGLQKAGFKGGWLGGR